MESRDNVTRSAATRTPKAGSSSLFESTGRWDFPSRFIPCRLHKHAAYWQWQPRGPNQSGFSYEDAVRSIQVDVVTVPEVCSGWFLFLASPVDGQSHEQQPTERILQPLTNRMLPYIRHMPTHVAAHEI